MIRRRKPYAPPRATPLRDERFDEALTNLASALTAGALRSKSRGGLLPSFLIEAATLGAAQKIRDALDAGLGFVLLVETKKGEGVHCPHCLLDLKNDPNEGKAGGA